MQTNKSTQAALAGNNLIIVLIVVSFLAIGVSVVVGRMLVTSIIRDTKVVNAKNKANTTLEKNLENAPKLIAAYEQLGNERTIVNDALPTTADLPSILVTLENISIQSKVILQSITPAAVRTVSATPAGNTQAVGVVSDGASAEIAPVPKAFRVSTKFTGSFDQMMEVVKAVELSARPMKLVSLKMSGSGNELAVGAEIETYYQDKAKLPFGEEYIK